MECPGAAVLHARANCHYYNIRWFYFAVCRWSVNLSGVNRIKVMETLALRELDYQPPSNTGGYF